MYLKATLVRVNVTLVAMYPDAFKPWQTRIPTILMSRRRLYVLPMSVVALRYTHKAYEVEFGSHTSYFAPTPRKYSVIADVHFNPKVAEEAARCVESASIRQRRKSKSTDYMEKVEEELTKSTKVDGVADIAKEQNSHTHWCQSRFVVAAHTNRYMICRKDWLFRAWNFAYGSSKFQ